MSRYFFDVDISGRLFADSEGTQFASRQGAMNEALRVAVEVARDELDTQHGDQSVRVTVRDTVPFYHATLSLTLGQP